MRYEDVLCRPDIGLHFQKRHGGKAYESGEIGSWRSDFYSLQ
jgi:hypothetical protein